MWIRNMLYQYPRRLKITQRWRASVRTPQQHRDYQTSYLHPHLTVTHRWKTLNAVWSQEICGENFTIWGQKWSLPKREGKLCFVIIPAIVSAGTYSVLNKSVGWFQRNNPTYRLYALHHGFRNFVDGMFRQDSELPLHDVRVRLMT